MATKAQKAKVGAFLFMSVAVIAAGIVIVAGLNRDERIPFTIVFDESVLGLNEGGLVEYQGMDVGTVSDMIVIEDPVSKTSRARVDILIKASKIVLREGVTARLVIYSFLTGTLCVSLEGGDPAAPVLAAYSVIPAKASRFESISASTEGLMSDFSILVRKLGTGFEGLKEGQFTQIAENTDALVQDTRELIQTTSDTVNGVRDDVELVLKDFDELVNNLNDVAATAQEWVEMAQAKIEPLDLERTQKSVEEALEAIADAAASLSARLETITETLDVAARAALHDVGNVTYSLTEGVRTLSEALEAIRSWVEYLEQDPAALIRGKGRPKSD